MLVGFSYLFVERILQIVQDLCADKPSRHFCLATSWEGFLPFTNFFNHLFSEFFSLEPIPLAAVVSLPGYPLSFLIPVLSVIVFPVSISRLGVWGSSWRNWFRNWRCWWRSVVVESPRASAVESVKTRLAAYDARSWWGRGFRSAVWNHRSAHR